MRCAVRSERMDRPTLRDDEQRIAAVPLWLGRAVSAQRLPGGNTNHAWRVTVRDPDACYFLKLHGPGTDGFIDREAAFEAAIRAGEMGHAPKLHLYDPAAGVEVFEFLQSYRSCDTLDAFDPVIRRGIIDIYRSIHGAAPLRRSNTGFEQFDRHLRRAEALHLPIRAGVEDLVAARARIGQAVAAAGMDLRFCFNDSYIANYMVDDRRTVRIVDWEFAGNNDPYWDLAMFALETFRTSPDDIDEMLEWHDGRARPDVAARVSAYTALAAATWGLWAACQDATSALPFDFGKYADILFMKARGLMAQPSWADRLARL